MRGYIPLAMFLANVLASDLSFCQKSCRNKFDTEIQKSTCFKGCEYRNFENQGMFFFINCHRKCDSTYGNSTTDEGAACHFACGLPMINSVFMSVNYNGKGKPEIQVIKHDGPKNDQSGETNEFSSQDIFKSFGQNPLLADSADDHFESIEDRFQKMLNRMRAEMRERFLDSHRSPFLANDPFNSNSLTSDLDNQGEVGNVNEYGDPILIVRPVFNAEDSNDDLNSNDNINQIPWQAKRAESWYGKEHLPLLFQIFFVSLSLLALLCMTFIFMRILKNRSERYQRVVNNPARVSSISTVPGSQVMPLKIEKKMSFEIEPPKDGVPPPAYDQLSLGSVHKKFNQNTAE